MTQNCWSCGIQDHRELKRKRKDLDLSVDFIIFVIDFLGKCKDYLSQGAMVTTVVAPEAMRDQGLVFSFSGPFCSSFNLKSCEGFFWVLTFNLHGLCSSVLNSFH